MKKDFESLLDESLERVRKGEKLEPSAEELKPLLELASRIQEISALPKEAFVGDLEKRLFEKMGALPRARRRSLWGRYLTPVFSLGRAKRWAAVLAVILALMLATAGTAIAAQRSVPGDPLYPVKRVTERLGLLVVRDLPGKTHLRLEFTRRRAEEIEALDERGEEVGETILVELATETEETLEEIEAGPEKDRETLYEKFVDLTERQQKVLERVRGRVVSERAKSALGRALEVSRRGHERAMEAIQQGRPEVPPGQEKEEDPGLPEDRGKRPEGPPGQEKKENPGPPEERGKGRDRH